MHLLAGRGSVLMAFLTAYLDESKSDPMFVLGGFVAPVQAWSRFSRNWKKVLNEYKVPYLHMKEFAFFKGPFKEWTEDDRKAFLGQLLFVITSASKQIYSFSCIFNYHDYDQILDPKLRMEQNHW